MSSINIDCYIILAECIRKHAENQNKLSEKMNIIRKSIEESQKQADTSYNPVLHNLSIPKN